MIYLASPYSHPSEVVQTRRFICVREFLFSHISQDSAIFSPIVYCHQFSRDFGAPGDYLTWKPFNDHMLHKSDEIWILRLKGWEASLGVAWERQLAAELGLPETFHDPVLDADY
jgi:hypothetical protein